MRFDIDFTLRYQQSITHKHLWVLNMGKLWNRVPDENGKLQLKEVNMAKVEVTGPTLIYLSGFLTNNNKPGYVAGGLKKVEELLGSRSEIRTQPKLYAWSHSSLMNLFNLAAYNMFPKWRASKAGYDLSASVLMPLVAQDFKRDGKKATGSPLPEEEVKKNLRNITLFGYSAGSIVAQETFNATLKMMKQVGYEEKTARRLLKEVSLVSVGTISRPSKETDRFTTVYLVAANDRINNAKNWIWGTLGTALRVIFKAEDRKNKDLSIRPLSDSSLFLTTSVRPTLYEWKYTDSGARASKKWFDPLYPKWTLRRSYHELPHYVTTDDKNNGFARIVLHALINAVNRTDSVTPLQLVSLPANDTQAEEAQAAYRDRIDNAVKAMPAAFQPKN